MTGQGAFTRLRGNIGRRLETDQAVEVIRGALAGMTGVLIDFHGERRCLVALDAAPKGVLLSIDHTAVKARNCVSDSIPPWQH